uniref:Phospholipase A2 n=1 Tax=Anabas testudineus TaxID=64144 RepID=A0AAQ6IBK2_ANATE
FLQGAPSFTNTGLASGQWFIQTATKKKKPSTPCCTHTVEVNNARCAVEQLVACYDCLPSNTSPVVWCCHRHDCCYGDAEHLGCHTKTDRYQWTCEDRTPECDDLKDKCENLLCKCDRDAAKCLRKAPFIQRYALWPDFLCGYEHPTCNIY